MGTWDNDFNLYFYDLNQYQHDVNFDHEYQPFYDLHQPIHLDLSFYQYYVHLSLNDINFPLDLNDVNLTFNDQYQPEYDLNLTLNDQYQHFDDQHLDHDDAEAAGLTS